MRNPRPGKPNAWLVTAGVLLLTYAVLGNYVALPGYLRFLARGGTSAAGNAFDFAVLIGAVKTILWMYSFQLGVLALAIARSLCDGLHTRYLIVAAVLWLTLWSWPSIPAPGAWFYLVFGGAILVGIALKLLQTHREHHGQLSRTLFLASMMFFAFATWEVCGLGSTGRILHPEQSAQPVAHNIVVTQSTKLMLELLIAWSCLLISTAVARTAEPGPV